MTAESEGLYNPQAITILMMYDWQVSFTENKAFSVAIGGSGTELGENPAAPAPVLRALCLSHIIAPLAPAPDSFGSFNGRKPHMGKHAGWHSSFTQRHHLLQGIWIRGQ